MVKRLLFRSLLLFFILLISCSTNSHLNNFNHDLGYVHGFNDGRDQAFVMQIYSRCLKIRSKKDCALLKKKIDNFEKKFDDAEARLTEQF
tara:strand:- start:2238 stop:2507 length:270 start_codon:yes stop_codon:yes gene_type:complete